MAGSFGLDLVAPSPPSSSFAPVPDGLAPSSVSGSLESSSARSTSSSSSFSLYGTSIYSRVEEVQATAATNTMRDGRSAPRPRGGGCMTKPWKMRRNEPKL